MPCKDCIYGRLICNKEKQKEYVGCIKFQAFDEDFFLKALDTYHYISPMSDIMYGWIYKNIPFGESRDSYDSVDSGIILNNCLISPRKAICDLFMLKI